MANTTIQIKKSATPSATPASLEYGELAINYADGKLFYKASNGAIYSLIVDSYSFATVNANSTLVIADVTGDIFSLVPGDFITITGDAINDRITIGANLKSVYDVANAAYNQANTGGADLSAANNWANTVAVYANNYAGAMANAANAYAASLSPDLSPVFTVANAAYDKANSANVLAYNTGISANNYAGEMANSANGYAQTIVDANLVTSRAYTNTSTTAANNYAGIMANSANARADTKVESVTGTIGQIFSSGGTTPTVNLISTGVTATTYGGATQIPVIVVDAFGRLTSASNVAVNGMDYPYVNTSTTAANNYAGAMANASNGFAQTIVNANLVTSRAYTNTSTTAANNYAGVMANSANAIADATYIKKTATTQTITGSLEITGNLILSGNATSISTQNLSIEDPLIFLATNNISDIVDIGFIGHYNNGTANVHTGVYRDHASKEYFVFNGLSGEPELVNDIVPYANNMVNAVLNADLRTSNLNLGGANAIVWIKSAFDTVNAAYTSSNADFTVTNAAFSKANNALANTSGVSFDGNLNIPTGNLAIGIVGASANLHVNGTVSITGSPANTTYQTLGSNTYSFALTQAQINTNPFISQGTVPNTMHGLVVSPRFESNTAAGIGILNNIRAIIAKPIVYTGSNQGRFNVVGVYSDVMRTQPEELNNTSTSKFLYGEQIVVGHGANVNSAISTSDVFGSTIDIRVPRGNASFITGLSLTTSLGSSSSGVQNNSISASIVYGIRTSAFTSTNTASIYTTTVGTYYDAHLGGISNNTNTTVTNKYGIYQTAADHINYFAGNVGIGRTTANYRLDVNGSTNASALLVNGSDISTIYATAASPTFTGTVNMQAAIANYTLTDAANIDWNLNTGQVATVTLAGNRIMNAPTNLRVGTFILHVIQDGVGGRTLTWNSVFKWPAGVAPVLTSTAGRRDLFSFVCDGTNLYGSFLPDVR